MEAVFATELATVRIRVQAEADATAEATTKLQGHARSQPAVPATGQPAKQQTHTRPAEQAPQQPAQATQQAAQASADEPQQPGTPASAGGTIQSAAREATAADVAKRALEQVISASQRPQASSHSGSEEAEPQTRQAGGVAAGSRRASHDHCQQ